MGNSNIVRIGDIAEVFDGPHATPKKIDVGPYFLSISSLENGQLDLSKSAHISDEQFEKWTRRVTPREGDVLFSYETRLGEAALMPDGIKACLGRRMGLLRPKRNKVLPEYLLYAYLSPEFQQQIKRRTNHGATVERISLKELPDFEIRVPAIEEQQKVVQVIKAFPRKLEVNQQTNQILEQMAQALFKSWFVDFDPVVDNALAAGNPIPDELAHRVEVRKKAHALPDFQPLPVHIRNLFPSEFEQTSEPSVGINGWVPKGWKYSELSKFISVKHGFAYKGMHFSNEPTGDVLLTPGNVAIGGGFKGDKYKYYSGPIMEDYIFETGDLYITMTDLSKAGDTLGYPAIVPHIEGKTFHHNQRLGKVEFKDNDKYGTEFIYRCLCSKDYRNYIVSSATGTTVKHTSPSKILKYKVINSGGLVEAAYDECVKVFRLRSGLTNKNSIALENLRDYLLPKLISGEIQLDLASKEKINQEPELQGM